MKYRKLPVVIEAHIWTGDEVDMLNWSRSVTETGLRPAAFEFGVDGDVFQIETLEGPHTVTIGDYVIQGVKGEFYPCKPDIFLLSYEPVS